MRWILVTAVALLAAAPAAAQEKGTWEFGADAGLTARHVSGTEDRPLGDSGRVLPGSDGFTDFYVTLPGTAWRIGYFLSPSVSVELPLAFEYVKYGSDPGTFDSSYSLRTGLGLIYSFDRGLLVGVNGMYRRSDIDYSDSDYLGDPPLIRRFGLGGTLGFRRQVFAENFRVRVSLDYLHTFEWEERGQPALDDFVLRFGFSVLL